MCAMIQKLRMNFGSIYLMTGRGSLLVMSDAAQLTPCNHSVCHKRCEAVDRQRHQKKVKDLTRSSLRSDTEGTEKKRVESARMRSLRTGDRIEDCCDFHVVVSVRCALLGAEEGGDSGGAGC